MASPFDYADASPYARLATEQLLDQSRRNPLQEMIAAYQAPQKYAQEQAAAQLQAQIQQANLQALQRAADPNDPANKLKMAIDQAQLANLQRDPRILAQQQADSRLKEDALKAILGNKNPNVVFEPVVDPAILAQRAEAEAAGGIPSTAYKQSDFVKMIPAGGGLPAMGVSAEAGRAGEARALQNQISLLNAKNDANGIPVEYFSDLDNNVQSRPKVLRGGATPGALLDAEGNPVKQMPKASDSGEKAKAKLVNDLARSVQSNKAYQAYREVTESLHGLEATLEYAKSNPQDQTGVKSSAVDAFNKIINPNSIVRQQAFAQTTTGSSLVNKAEILFNSFINSQSITAAQIQAMLDLAKKYQEGSKQTVQRELATIKRRGDKGGIDPEDYLPDIFNEGSQAPVILKTWEEGAALEPNTPYIGPDGKPYTRGAKK